METTAATKAPIVKEEAELGLGGSEPLVRALIANFWPLPQWSSTVQ